MIMLFLLAIFIILRQLLPLGKLIQDFPLNDFSVYRDGVATTIRGENPYTQWFFDRYNYSPAATILFLPIHYLPVDIAEFVFTALSLTALWFTLTYILYSMRVKLSLTFKVFLYALLVKMYPAKLTLVLGQVNLLVLFLIIASFYLHTQKRIWLSGISLGLATIIKLHPVFLFVFFFFKKSNSIIITGMATIVVLHLAAVALFGWPLTVHYYSSVIPELLSKTSQTSVNATYMNQSLTAFLARFGVFGVTATLIRYITSGGLLIWLLAHFPKSPLKQFSWYSLLLIVTTLIAPVFVWQHHFVFLIPAWLVLVAQRKVLLAAGTYLLLILYFRNPNLPIQQHPLIATHFLVIAIGLSLILLADLAPLRRQS